RSSLSLSLSPSLSLSSTAPSLSHSRMRPLTFSLLATRSACKGVLPVVARHAASLPSCWSAIRRHWRQQHAYGVESGLSCEGGQLAVRSHAKSACHQSKDELRWICREREREREPCAIERNTVSHLCVTHSLSC